MKYAVALLCLVSGGAVAAPACAPDKAAIVAGEQAWTDAFIKSDPTAVKRLVADDFVGVSTKGEMYGKSRAIADVAAGGSTEGGLGEVHVTFHGDTAIAQGRSWSKERSGAQDHLIWLDTWMCRGGAWQVVGAMDAHK